MPEISCQVCGKSFQAQRRSARYCSDYCKLKSHRHRKRAADDLTIGQALKQSRISGVHPLIGSKGAISGPEVLKVITDNCITFDRWIEPFLGSGALYLEALKADLLSPHQAVLNDLNGWMVATLRALRNDPKELQRRLALMPIAAAEFDHTVEPDHQWSDADVAVWWLARNYHGFVGNFKQNRFAVDRSGNKSRKWDRLIQHLPTLCRAFVGPTVMNIDALELIRKECTGRTNDLVVVDPPYFGTEHAYAEGGFNQHEALAELLECVPASGVVVMYYDCPELRALYPKNRWLWVKREAFSSIGVSKRADGSERTEVVLLRRSEIESEPIAGQLSLAVN